MRKTLGLTPGLFIGKRNASGKGRSKKCDWCFSTSQSLQVNFAETSCSLYFECDVLCTVCFAAWWCRLSTSVALRNNPNNKIAHMREKISRRYLYFECFNATKLHLKN